MEHKAREKSAVLLLDSEEQHAVRIQDVLEDNGFQVTWVDRHLAGLALLDEQDFSVILAACEGQDITGFEFCFLLRRRQERRNAAVPAVILMGRDREALVQSDPDTTDYVLEPCLDAEIVWRLERNIAVGAKCSVRAQGMQVPINALNKEDLHSVLLAEVSRGSRRSESIGLVLIKVTGWSLLAMDYGPGGAQIVEDIILSRIQALVRSYDGVFRIEQGRFVVLLPHTGNDGLKGFVQRAKIVLQTILFRDAFVQDELEAVHIEGIGVYTHSQYRAQSEAIQELYKYILTSVLSDKANSDYVCVQLGTEESPLTMQVIACGKDS
jgi:CheY-like chemotaxis protein